jgi:hypothetical protein
MYASQTSTKPSVVWQGSTKDGYTLRLSRSALTQIGSKLKQTGLEHLVRRLRSNNQGSLESAVMGAIAQVVSNATRSRSGQNTQVFTAVGKTRKYQIATQPIGHQQSAILVVRSLPVQEFEYEYEDGYEYERAAPPKRPAPAAKRPKGVAKRPASGAKQPIPARRSASAGKAPSPGRRSASTAGKAPSSGRRSASTAGKAPSSGRRSASTAGKAPSRGRPLRPRDVNGRVTKAPPTVITRTIVMYMSTDNDIVRTRLAPAWGRTDYYNWDRVLQSNLRIGENTRIVVIAHGNGTEIGNAAVGSVDISAQRFIELIRNNMTRQVVPAQIYISTCGPGIAEFAARVRIEAQQDGILNQTAIFGHHDPVQGPVPPPNDQRWTRIF